ncbi:hypothetical protein TrLO_g10292 [Triparma laevis f. longispina]|uniref:Tyrosine-protein kinase ephrin type A/B receptor-like domain-containing protein n=1 Tax=Triparma laevis f. longispina TaxID=1714387 RepID=A0A9W7KYD9_9STRA|nr:hypothetical protein TrLO_g10292 [Triparma laevis f. longispina]
MFTYLTLAFITIPKSLSKDCSQVTDYEALFDCVSNYSPHCHSCHKSKTLANEPEITLGKGTYACATDKDEHCAGDVDSAGSDQYMFAMDQPYYIIKCEDDTSPTCVLDGNSKRALMHINDHKKDGKSTTIFRSITFQNGLTNGKLSAGALYLGGNTNGADVQIERCMFTSCADTTGTAIYVDKGRNAASNVRFYETTFSSNILDIEEETDSISHVTVYATCSPGTKEGNPAQGDALITKGPIEPSPSFSFSEGTCVNAFKCPAGSSNPGQTDDASGCKPCAPGSYSLGTSSEDCSPCDPDCEPGFYSPEMASVCTPCPPGQAQADPKSFSCVDCSPGTFTNVTRSTECKKCDPGSVALAEKNHCDYCGAGKYAANKTQTCENCAIGTYSVGGVDKCLDCPSGKFNQDEGGESCSSCEPGTFPDWDGENYLCTECEPGKYAEFGFQECKKCEGKGTYSPYPKSAYCSVAGAGQYPSEDRTKLIDCDINTFSIGASDTCENCTVGTFSNVSAAGCKACGMYETNSGSSITCTCLPTFITVEDIDPETRKITTRCTCPVGKTLSAGKNGEPDSCTTCDDGRFKNGPGAFGCDICDDEVISLAFYSIPGIPKSTPNSCACGPGKYWDFRPNRSNDKDKNKPDDRCEPCPTNSTGGTCTDDENEIGLTVKTLPLAPGYWRYVNVEKNMYSTVILPCEVKEACMPQTADQTADPDPVCSPGHQGPLCSVCKDDHSKNSLGVCEQCVPQTVALYFYIGSAVVVLVGTYFIVKKIFGGTVSNVFNPYHQLPMRRKGAEKAWDSLKTKLKILTSFYQIVSGLPKTLALTFPSIYRSFTKVTTIIFNVDALQIISVNCVVPTNFYTLLLITMLTPIVLALLVATLTFFQLRKINDPAKREEVKSFRFSLALCVAYIIFSSTSTIAFETFQCAKYGDDENFDDTTYYLVSDRSIDCGSQEHKNYELYAYSMILVYPIGITAIYALQLFKYRHYIANDAYIVDDATKKSSEARDDEEQI